MHKPNDYESSDGIIRHRPRKSKTRKSIRR
jgi:hypothetical protein